MTTLHGYVYRTARHMTQVLMHRKPGFAHCAGEIDDEPHNRTFGSSSWSVGSILALHCRRDWGREPVAGGMIAVCSRTTPRRCRIPDDFPRHGIAGLALCAASQRAYRVGSVSV